MDIKYNDYNKLKTKRLENAIQILKNFILWMIYIYIYLTIYYINSESIIYFRLYYKTLF